MTRVSTPLLPRASLLAGCRDPEALGRLIDQAETALRLWEPVWTDFVAAPVRQEAIERLGGLSELSVTASGGMGWAERCRLCLQRAEQAPADPSGPERGQGLEPPEAPLMGLEVIGNFLFDPSSPTDFRAGLEMAGATAGELGDLWVRGDRGAQLVTTPELASRLNGQLAQVRTVEVQLEAIPLGQLQPPVRPQPRTLTTVEASRRLDAVASAGFGVSRSRMADLIRKGAVRVGWQAVTTPSRELAAGDRIQLENRGELEVVELEPTKRDRWRLRLRRT